MLPHDPLQDTSRRPAWATELQDRWTALGTELALFLFLVEVLPLSPKQRGRVRHMLLVALDRMAHDLARCHRVVD